MCTNMVVKIVFTALFEIVKAKMQYTLYSSENKVEKNSSHSGRSVVIVENIAGFDADSVRPSQ